MWPQGSRHRRWPPGPSNKEYRWRCSFDRSSCRAVPTLQSQLRHKKYRTISHLRTTTIFASWCGSVIYVCMYDCVIVLQLRPEACRYAWETAVHVLMCHTQFDFGILREQNILPLNVSVNHMMGVKMGKTLKNKYAQTQAHIQTQSDDHNHYEQTQTLV